MTLRRKNIEDNTIEEVKEIIKWLEWKLKQLRDRGVGDMGHLEGQLTARKRQLKIMLQERRPTTKKNAFVEDTG